MEQFWDGRAVDLQQQAGGPPLNPVEMASTSWEDIIAKLQQDPQLTQDFAQVYPQGYSEDTITDAIAEFEKTLTTPNSPFDHYLKGETQALTTSQQKGLALFQQNKCDTCHVGKNIGGQSYEFLIAKKSKLPMTSGVSTSPTIHAICTALKHRACVILP